MPHDYEGFVKVGFVSEACETADRLVDALTGFVAQVTTADGKTHDYELRGCEVWDGHVGMPITVRALTKEHSPTGPFFVVDATEILIY